MEGDVKIWLKFCLEDPKLWCECSAGDANALPPDVGPLAGPLETCQDLAHYYSLKLEQNYDLKV